MADDLELKRRVEILESEVRELRRDLHELRANPEPLETAAGTDADISAEAAPPPPDSPPIEAPPVENVEPQPPPTLEPPAVASDVFSTSGIIAKIGIALVLLGVAFLLKYGYDHGWLTETMRVFMGLATGAALLAGGMHQRRQNDVLSAVLLGGSVAVFYGTFFAAYRLFDLIGWSVAVASMVGTTMLGFMLSVTQDRASLASIAAIGGLATPFLLDAPDGGPELLAVYTIVVLLGTSAIYLMRGWRSLLLTSAIGGLAVMLALTFEAQPHASLARTALVLSAILVTVAAGSIAPLIRAVTHKVELGWVEQCLAFIMPFAAIGLIGIMIDSSLPHAAWVAVLGTIYFAAHHLANQRGNTYSTVASALVASAVGIIAGVEPMAMAMIGVAFGANKEAAEDAPALRPLGYAALGALGLWTSVLLLNNVRGTPFLNPSGLQMMLAVATVAAVGLTHPPENTLARSAHAYIATLAGMLMVVHQLQDVPGGHGIATAIWGAFAIGAIVLGVVRDRQSTQVLGMVVIVMTAGKLLIVDLESVATIWRVALFMTFGGAMLYISYLVPRWQRPE